MGACEFSLGLQLRFAFSGGLGYTYAFFDSEQRTFHDVFAKTQVRFVPKASQSYVNQAAFQTASIPLPANLFSIRAKVSEAIPVHEFTERMTAAEISKVIVLSNQFSERPSATIIQLPIQAKVASTETQTAVEGNLAQIIEMPDSIGVADRKKRAA